MTGPRRRERRRCPASRSPISRAAPCGPRPRSSPRSSDDIAPAKAPPRHSMTEGARAHAHELGNLDYGAHPTRGTGTLNGGVSPATASIARRTIGTSRSALDPNSGSRSIKRSAARQRRRIDQQARRSKRTASSRSSKPGPPPNGSPTSPPPTAASRSSPSSTSFRIIAPSRARELFFRTAAPALAKSSSCARRAAPPQGRVHGRARARRVSRADRRARRGGSRGDGQGGRPCSCSAPDPGTWSGVWPGSSRSRARRPRGPLDNTLTRPLAERDPLVVVAATGALVAALTTAVAVLAGEHLPPIRPALVLVACGATGYGLSLWLYLLAQRRHRRRPHGLGVRARTVRRRRDRDRPRRPRSSR